VDPHVGSPATQAGLAAKRVYDASSVDAYVAQLRAQVGGLERELLGVRTRREADPLAPGHGGPSPEAAWRRADDVLQDARGEAAALVAAARTEAATIVADGRAAASAMIADAERRAAAFTAAARSHARPTVRLVGLPSRDRVTAGARDAGRAVTMVAGGDRGAGGRLAAGDATALPLPVIHLRSVDEPVAEDAMARRARHGDDPSLDPIFWDDTRPLPWEMDEGDPGRPAGGPAGDLLADAGSPIDWLEPGTSVRGWRRRFNRASGA
jgi:hypothetical protein